MNYKHWEPARSLENHRLEGVVPISTSSDPEEVSLKAFKAEIEVIGADELESST